MTIKSNFSKVVLMLAAVFAISGCNSGKKKNLSNDPDIQLEEMSEEEKSKAEVRYVMLHVNDFSFDESDNGTYEVEDKMKQTHYVKIFEKDNYQDALGSIVTEYDKAKGYGIRMKLGEDKRSLEPDDKYFSGLIWHIRPGKTYIEYIFDSEEPRHQFLQEAVGEGFTQVNDSVYSRGKPKMSCITLSRYKGWPSLMLICY